MISTSRNGCGPGNRITIQPGFLSTTSPTPLVCSLPPVCMPSIRTVALLLFRITKNLLASTGEAPAADLAARFGIDIRTKAFWQDSIKIIEKRVERYCVL